MKSHKVLITAALALAGSAVHGSGFVCEGDGIRARLYNHVSPGKGTRVPAAFIVSTDAEGTILVRKGPQIEKHLGTTSVRYVVAGGPELGADTVTLEIWFREGKGDLEDGDVVDGGLYMVGLQGTSEMRLGCQRYLKH